jgi:hypothetical protein
VKIKIAKKFESQAIILSMNSGKEEKILEVLIAKKY